MNNPFSGVAVKDGYTMLALVNDRDVFYAIIRRESMKDYVFCYAYDPTDGTWGNGFYFTTYTAAAKALAERLI